MRVTFLAHSGFFLELETASLLFDWWKGELPPLPADRPLLALLVAIPAAVILGVIVALVQRIHEIGRGEEDDAKKY